MRSAFDIPRPILLSQPLSEIRETSFSERCSSGSLTQKLTIELMNVQNSKLVSTNQMTHTESSPIAPLTLLNRRWRVVGPLGEGAFSRVFEAEDTLNLNRTYVLKIYKEEFTLLALREKLIVQSLTGMFKSSPNYFVRCFGGFFVGSEYCVRFEKMTFTLYHFIEPDHPSQLNYNHTSISSVSPLVKLKPVSLRGSFVLHQAINLSGKKKMIDMEALHRVAISLLSGLNTCHQRGIIHADIKLENLYVSCSSRVESLSRLEDLPFNTRFKIGDFSNSFHKSEFLFHDSNTDFNIQSLPYRAPEVLLGCPFGVHIDIWSVGVVFLELILGRRLFHATSPLELLELMNESLSSPLELPRFVGGKHFSSLRKQCSASYALQSVFQYDLHVRKIRRLLNRTVSNISPDLVHFLAGLLHPNPEERFTAAEALQHSFLAPSIPVPLISYPSALGNEGVATRNAATCRTLLRAPVSAEQPLSVTAGKEGKEESALDGASFLEAAAKKFGTNFLYIKSEPAIKLESTMSSSLLKRPHDMP